MKNILVVTSSDSLSHLLSNEIQETQVNCNIFYAHDFKAAAKWLVQYTIDLFMIEEHPLNVSMESVTGFQLMQKIRQFSKYCFTPIFFFPKSEKSTLYAYQRFHCFACFESPLNMAQLRISLRKALTYETPRYNCQDLFFKTDGTLYHIAVREIVYFVCSRSGVHLHTTDGQIHTFAYQTCENLLKTIDSPDFVQCSKGIVINKNYVEAIDGPNQSIYFYHISDVVEFGKNFCEELFQALGIATAYRHSKYPKIRQNTPPKPEVK